MVVGVIAAAMVASTIVTSYVKADTPSDRKNSNLDKHIAKGGAHGAEAQKLKDRVDDGTGAE